MNKEYKSINKIGLITIVGMLCVELVNFLLIPILTRTLGTSGYGVISLYSTWVSIIVAVAGLQTTQSIVYIVNDEKKDVQNGKIASMLACSLVSFFILLVLSMLFFLFTGRLFSTEFKVLTAIAILHACGQYIVSFGTTLYTQKQQPMLQALISIIIAVSTSVLSIILILIIKDADEKYYGRVFGFAVSYIVMGIVLSGIIVFPYIKEIRRSVVRQYIPLCIPIIFHSLSNVIYGQSDRLMLNAFLNDKSEVGIYSFSYSIATLICVLWTALNTFFQPFLFRYLKNSDYEELKKRRKNILSLFFMCYLIFIMLIPEAAEIYGGEEFVNGITYIPVLSFAFFVNFLYVFDVNYESYLKRPKIIAMGTMLAAVLNIVLNWMLIPVMQTAGAVLATVISYIALFVFHHFNALRLAKSAGEMYPYNRKETYFYFVIGGVAMIIMYALMDMAMIRWIVGIIAMLLLLYMVLKRRSLF